MQTKLLSCQPIDLNVRKGRASKTIATNGYSPSKNEFKVLLLSCT